MAKYRKKPVEIEAIPYIDPLFAEIESFQKVMAEAQKQAELEQKVIKAKENNALADLIAEKVVQKLKDGSLVAEK